MRPARRTRNRPVTLRGSLLGALTICLAGLAGFLVMALLIAPHLTQIVVSAPSTPGYQRGVEVEPPSVRAAADLVERHDCWSGAAPADMQGQLSGHVVVTKPGAIAPVYEGGRTVGAALEHVFESKYPRLTVHAFCR